MSASTQSPKVQTPKPPAEETASSVKMIRLMGSVSLICGLLIVTTYRSTLVPIRRNQEIIMKETVAELLPGVEKQVIYGVQPSGQLTVLQGLDYSGPRLFAGYDSSGALLGVVIEASDRGYADVIRAMYAYSPSQQAITGFKVVELKETPGLGDKITSDPGFLANFKNLDVRLNADKTSTAHPVTTVKHGTKKNPWEVDAISGATISSRAVGRALDKSTRDLLPIVNRNLSRIEKGE
jgi:electron transport complex protein RnfG